jgi:hypothetical protein
MHRTFAVALCFLAVTHGAPAVFAQPAPEATGPCPAGNLLAGKKPSAWLDIRGRTDLATDGERAPEGALWNAPLAIVLATGAASLTWDLGTATTLDVAWIQADANDHYTVWGSLDGQNFRTLGRIDPVPGHGLRGRKLALGGAQVRYLRFGEGMGDGLYSLAEITVFCQTPTPFPPALRVGKAAVATARPTIYDYWNDASSARWQLVLALGALALLRWGRKLAREGRPQAYARLRARLLAALGVLAALTYVNFGFFHFGNFIHTHEWTHYYLGSKYFNELASDRLYVCLSTADVEAGLRRRVELRKIRNLRTNDLERTDAVLAHPERCKQHFSADRWAAFKKDVAFFRGRIGPRGWDDIQLDHGYNATPIWTALGGALAQLAPASPVQLTLLAALDPLALLAALGLIHWAFGWRVLCFALVAFATNFPSRFYWTGGAFLRWDWIFFLVAGIACLKKQRPVLAGIALATAAGLRVFPVFVFFGPLFAALWHWAKERRPRRSDLQFFAAAALAGVMLFAVGLARTGGPATFARFVANTEKHQATPLTNHMGLRTVLAWRPSEVGRHLHDEGAVDPWRRWKDARLGAWQTLRPLLVVIVLGCLALLALAARRHEPWVVAALATMLIAFAVELTSYYYAFILCVALLVQQHQAVGRALLGLTAFTQFIAWAPLRNMSTWLDEQFTLMSVATLAVFGFLLWRFRDTEGFSYPSGNGRPGDQIALP